jgi:hypothetical protein
MTRVRKSDITKAVLAVRAAGVEAFELSFDERGLPVIRARPVPLDSAAASAADEIAEWANGQARG